MIGVTACGRAYWTKPGFNQSDWNRDSYECERDMRQSGYFGTGWIGAGNAQGFFERCLGARGYYKVRGEPQRTYSPPAPQSSLPMSPMATTVTTAVVADGSASAAGIVALDDEAAEARYLNAICQRLLENERQAVSLRTFVQAADMAGGLVGNAYTDQQRTELQAAEVNVVQAKADLAAAGSAIREKRGHLPKGTEMCLFIDQ
jgi:hypothetical protein